MEGWAKIKTASRYADVGERTFRKWLKQGLTHSRLQSGTVLIRFSDIDKWLINFAVKEDHISNIIDQVLQDIN